MRRLLALTLLMIVVAAACATEWVGDDARQHSRRAVVSPSPEPTTTTPTEPEPAAFVPGECPMPIQSDDADRLTCGVLDVPLDRDDPAAGRVEVAVAIIASDAADAAPDPIVYLHGGPGGLALSDYLEWVFPSHPLLAERDVILVDQRGSGWSQPSLNCPQAEDANQPVAALLDCQDELDDAGVDLDDFTTADIAADIADLRQVLDIDQWNIYGVSYGTRVALTVLDLDPDGVRAAVLDSAYPPEVDAYYEQVANGSAAIDDLLAACAADARCGGAFGDLRDPLDTLLLDLAADPVAVDVDAGEPRLVVDDALLASALFSALYDRFTIPDVPLAVQTAVDGDLATALDLLGAADGLRAGFQTEDDEAAQYESLFDAELAFWAPECAEEIELAERAVIRDAVDLDEPVQAALIDEVESAFDVCARLDVTPARQDTQAPVASDVPTLLLVGEFDPITPVTWSQRAAAALTDASVIEVTGSGHAPSFEQCPREAMVAFVDEPSAPPTVPCLAEMQGLPFSLE